MVKERNQRGLRRLVVEDKEEAGYNISWSAIIAGVVTFLAFLLTLSLIGSAIGFGTVEPTSNNPFDGVGTGLMIWTVVSFILSLTAAGFVAGITARRVGFVHGFLTWATSVLVLLLLLSYVTAGVFSAVGSALGSVFSVAGKGAETVASSAGDLVSSSFDQIVGNVEDVDTNELEGQVNDILKDTDVPELQPNYINGQLDAAKDDIMDAGKQLALNPDNSDEIISQTKDSLQNRAQTISDAADKDAIANAVESNTDLNQQEAEEATNNIYNSLQSASEEAQTQLNRAEQGIDEAQQKLDQTVKEARVKADQASDTTAKASIWGFVALLLGMILTSLAGLWGSRFVRGRNEEKM
ncbi:hypothetical protein [Pisciglobus halotolerans]|uniref:CAP-Gly protein n=1 Tax=Pisciglobus halotolerans TaxID=745365 RepID=A0A1I3DP24_9LACT|nr:hypothetical protein [Pisciglobus halotolerans]SFH88504.1 hypothetical protein SAMN04489868_14611 [Pisciglobus halotolerans]